MNVYLTSRFTLTLRKSRTAQKASKYNRNWLTTRVWGSRGLNQRVDMPDSLAGVVLAAGAGRRLRPLTARRAKALCPLGDRALLDHALDRITPAVGQVAVNVHHRAGEIIEHLDHDPPRVHISLEEPVALGTAGAVGYLSPWLEGRAVLVTNADTWHDADLGGFVSEWDHERVAVLSNTAGPLGPRSIVVASILPAAVAGGLPSEPSGLWERVWRNEARRNRLQTVHTASAVLDCGTPARYLSANLRWALRFSGGATGGDAPRNGWVHPTAAVTGSVQDSVVGEGAVVAGRIRNCVVWPGSTVEAPEDLTAAIRALDLTVMVRGHAA